MFLTSLFREHFKNYLFIKHLSKTRAFIDSGSDFWMNEDSFWSSPLRLPWDDRLLSPRSLNLRHGEFFLFDWATLAWRKQFRWFLGPADLWVSPPGFVSPWHPNTLLWSSNFSNLYYALLSVICWVLSNGMNNSY